MSTHSITTALSSKVLTGLNTKNLCQKINFTKTANNNKTVAKAYQLLERDEVIQTKGYRGTFIHPNAKANSKVDLNEWVLSKFDETISALRGAGVTNSEIRIAFGNVMNNQK